MDEVHFNIRHGEFLDVDGVPKRRNTITFVPARVTLHGYESACHLKDYLVDAPPVTKALVHPGKDAPWVLGRLIRHFGTQQVPEEDRIEKSFFFASFLAVLHEKDHLAVPFECSDYYGRSALTFSSDDPPDHAVQQAIANAFWGLLLADPDDVADYQDRMHHPGEGVWIRFGVEDGEPFLMEEPEA